MIELTTTPCPGWGDGTIDKIQLQFRNRNSRSILRDTCRTDDLDMPGKEFVRGREDKWGGNMLSSCFGHRFRPIHGLDFRFHSTKVGSWFSNSADKLKLCKVSAQFGSRGQLGYSLWQWSGTATNVYFPDDDNSSSNWNTMRKIEG